MERPSVVWTIQFSHVSWPSADRPPQLWQGFQLDVF
jgi:hypothetical protein